MHGRETFVTDEAKFQAVLRIRGNQGKEGAIRK